MKKAGKKRPSPLADRRAFTLLEMLVTLAVFIMLSGAVFSLISATLQSSTALVDDQNRRDETVALRDFIENAFSKVNGQDRLALLGSTDSAGVGLKLILTQGGDYLALSTRRRANGLLDLEMAQRPAASLPATATRLQEFARLVDVDKGGTPLVLLSDINQVVWRFKALDGIRWDESLPFGSATPALIELVVTRAGSAVPDTFDFWLPPRFDPSRSAAR